MNTTIENSINNIQNITLFLLTSNKFYKYNYINNENLKKIISYSLDIIKNINQPYKELVLDDKNVICYIKNNLIDYVSIFINKINDSNIEKIKDDDSLIGHCFKIINNNNEDIYLITKTNPILLFNSKKMFFDYSKNELTDTSNMFSLELFVDIIILKECTIFFSEKGKNYFKIDNVAKNLCKKNIEYLFQQDDNLFNKLKKLDSALVNITDITKKLNKNQLYKKFTHIDESKLQELKNDNFFENKISSYNNDINKTLKNLIVHLTGLGTILNENNLRGISKIEDIESREE